MSSALDSAHFQRWELGAGVAEAWKLCVSESNRREAGCGDIAMGATGCRQGLQGCEPGLGEAVGYENGSNVSRAEKRRQKLNCREQGGLLPNCGANTLIALPFPDPGSPAKAGDAAGNLDILTRGSAWHVRCKLALAMGDIHGTKASLTPGGCEEQAGGARRVFG